MENQQEEGTFPTNMEEDVSISKRKKKCPENMWNYLPRDVGRIVCMLLGDVDMLGYLLFIAKEWVIFGDEQIYRDVATRVYISQTGRQLLNVQRWAVGAPCLYTGPGYAPMDSTHCVPLIGSHRAMTLFGKRRRESTPRSGDLHSRIITSSRSAFTLRAHTLAGEVLPPFPVL